MDKMYNPKPGDVIPNWDAPAGPYHCSESMGPDKIQGDNPSFSVDVSLKSGPDIRKYSGGRNSDPAPGKVGA